MDDYNTTMLALDVATNRLNWYIGFSVLAVLVSTVAVIVSVLYNKKSIENSNENHTEQLVANENRHKEQLEANNTKHKELFRESQKQLENSDIRHKDIFDESKRQLSENHEWNRRQLALTEIMSNRYNLNESIRALNESINFREQQGSYSLEEIHNALCDEKDHEKHPDLTIKGKEIKHHIFAILNYYEYLAVGIKNSVFAEKITKDSVKGALKKANKVFGEYITHLRTSKHTGNEKLFIELETLAKEWTREEEIDLSSIESKPTG